MAAHQRGCIILAKWTALVLMLSQLVSVIALAAYFPSNSRYNNPIMADRSSDYDDILDDTDQDPSASYQNPNKNQGGVGASDGYEDNEPDGPYDETPRDEEGQADMERFFEDHLGASERDGMDNENLPSNSILTVAPSPRPTSAANSISLHNDHLVDSSNLAYGDRLIPVDSERKTTKRLPNSDSPVEKYLKHTEISPNVKTKYIKLPNKPLTITRQITQGTNIDGETADEIPSENKRNFRRKQQRGRTNKDGVIVTEDDEMDKVYVTRLTDKPFKIDALGGFDPEEDFQDASRDIEETGKDDELSVAEGDKRGETKRLLDPSSNNDITFSDPEADSLFNDASATDEVAFTHDDPYQTDLEAEIDDHNLTEPSDSASTADREIKPRISSTDDSEGAWVNDGVDDMEIPSQSHQDSVLDKAEIEEVPSPGGESGGRSVNDAPQDNNAQQTPEETDEVSERMPNAAYMKNDSFDYDDNTQTPS